MLQNVLKYAYYAVAVLVLNYAFLLQFCWHNPPRPILEMSF